MGRKLKIGAIALVVLGTLMAGVAYAWDRSADDKIAAGVTIAGLDVGEMTRDAAIDAVRRDVAKPLAKPVNVRWRGNEWSLEPKQAKLRVDVEGMVDEAFEASEEGSLLARTWRRVSGGELDTSIAATPRFSENRVEKFVGEVAEAVDREPRNATIEPSAADLSRLHSRAGLQVRRDDLADAIAEVIGNGRVATVKAQTDRITPEVRTRDLAAQYPHYLTVDRTNNVLRHFESLKLRKEYTISVGAVGYETPAGQYSITSKQVDPTWHVPDSDWAGKLAGKVIPGGVPENPLKARWLGIYNGVGIHGTSETDKLGGPASHGCIRMAVPEVVELFDVVPTGTPIFIA